MDNRKGVISKISPDEDMPRDDFGNVAHLVMDPNSVTARANPSQFWACGINWISEFVRRRVIELGKTDKIAAFDMLVDYFNDVRPNYAEMTKKVYTTPAGKAKLVQYVEDNFIKIHIPPFYNGLTLEKVLYLRDKWQVPESPATFVLRDSDGKPDVIRTEDIVRIGRKYVMCLEKIPHASSPGFARVSHQGYPIKASAEAKLRSPIAANPIKTGEDEIRFMMADTGSTEISRYINIMGNSPIAGVDKMARTLMTAPFPTQITRIDVSNKDLALGNTILGTFHHETSILGIDTRQTRATNYDMKFVDGVSTAESDDVLFMTPKDAADLGEIADMEITLDDDDADRKKKHRQ